MIRLVGVNSGIQTSHPSVPDFPVRVHLFDLRSTDLNVDLMVSHTTLNPSSYIQQGVVPRITLESIGCVTTPGLISTLELVRDDTILGSLSWTENTWTKKSVELNLANNEGKYLCRIRCSGSTDPLVDYALFGVTYINFSWSYP